MNLVSFGYNYSFLLQALCFLWLASHDLVLYLLVHNAVLLADLRDPCTLLLFIFSFESKVMAPVSATFCFGTPVFALHFVLSFLILTAPCPIIF